MSWPSLDWSYMACFGLKCVLLEKHKCFDVLSGSPDQMKVVFQVAASQNKVYLSADSLVLNLQDDSFNK